MSDSDNVIQFRKKAREPQETEVEITIKLDADGNLCDASVSGDYDGSDYTLARSLYSLAWLVSNYHRDRNHARTDPSVVFAAYINDEGGFYLACREEDFKSEEQKLWLEKQLRKLLISAPLSSAEVQERFGETSQMQESCSGQQLSFALTTSESTTPSE